MILIGKLYLEGNVIDYSTLCSLSEAIKVDMIESESISFDDQNVLFVYVTDIIFLTRVLQLGKNVLAARLLHSFMEDFTLDENIVYTIDTVSMKLIKSSKYELDELIKPIAIETIIPKNTFLNLCSSEEAIKFYCESHSCVPIWSLFFNSLDSMRLLLNDLPTDNSYYINDNIHPIVLKVLNSAVRKNKDYLCIVKTINGVRTESDDRIPIYGYISSYADTICKIILNDF